MLDVLTATLHNDYPQNPSALFEAQLSRLSGQVVRRFLTRFTGLYDMPEAEVKGLLHEQYLLCFRTLSVDSEGNETLVPLTVGQYTSSATNSKYFACIPMEARRELGEALTYWHVGRRQLIRHHHGA